MKEVTHQQLLGQEEEEESWELKYQQLAESSNSTIQLMEEERERMREEIESLRSQQVAQLTTEHSPRDTNGDVNGNGMVTEGAISTQPNGMYTEQESAVVERQWQATSFALVWFSSSVVV